MTDIQRKLFELQDLKYRDFHSRLMPDTDKELIIGVRTPLLRKLAKDIIKSGNDTEFIKHLPHKYYEENNIHSCILCSMKDYGRLMSELERFIPHIDNWATCDMTSLKIFKNHTNELLIHILEWIKSDHTYTVRFAIKMLMDFYLDSEFNEKYLGIVSQVESEEYYIRMMIAWYFATALAKRWEDALPYIENRIMPKWVHNKAIQKAVESYRITNEQKDYLKTLRIK